MRIDEHSDVDSYDYEYADGERNESIMSEDLDEYIRNTDKQIEKGITLS